MAIRQIRYEGDDILRKKCKMVEEVNEHIRMLLDDMLDTLHNTKDGAAIAAPQVGILQRLVVIDMGNGVIKLINPEIIEERGNGGVMLWAVNRSVRKKSRRMRRKCGGRTGRRARGRSICGMCGRCGRGLRVGG